MAVFSAAFWAMAARAWRQIVAALTVIGFLFGTLFGIYQFGSVILIDFWKLSRSVQRVLDRVDDTSAQVGAVKVQIEDLKKTLNDHTDELKKLNSEPTSIASVQALTKQVEENHESSMVSRAKQDRRLGDIQTKERDIQTKEASQDQTYHSMQGELQNDRRRLQKIEAQVSILTHQ